MLSEDEKEAIKKVEEIKNMKFIITSSFYSRGALSLSIVEKEAIDIVLNLVEKLIKEAKEKDEEIKFWKEQAESYQGLTQQLKKEDYNTYFNLGE